MGVYRYTLRAGTKRLGGHEIGQFKFAHKVFWGDHRDPVCARLLKAGERAASKLQRMGCKLFVHGSWSDQQPVYFFDMPFASFIEDMSRFAPQVGRLHQTARRRWWLELFSEEEMLQRFPEIGILQTEEGKVYYHHLRGWAFKSPSLNKIAQDVMSFRSTR